MGTSIVRRRSRTDLANMTGGEWEYERKPREICRTPNCGARERRLLPPVVIQ
jgi:hypothetical protein